MSIEKSEMKVQLTHDYGCLVDDFLEGAEASKTKLIGAVEAYKHSRVVVQKIASTVKQDVESGKFEDLTELEVASLIKKYLDRAVIAMEKLASQAQMETVRVDGESRGLRKVVKLLRTDYESERTRIVNARSALRQSDLRSEEESGSGTNIGSSKDLDPNANPKENVLFIDTATATITEMKDPTHRPIGVHPGRGLAADRKQQTLSRQVADVMTEEASDGKNS